MSIKKTPYLVKRLFETEVSEIKDGIVKIVNIAREEGSEQNCCQGRPKCRPC